MPAVSVRQAFRKPRVSKGMPQELLRKLMPEQPVPVTIIDRPDRPECL